MVWIWSPYTKYVRHIQGDLAPRFGCCLFVSSRVSYRKDNRTRFSMALFEELEEVKHHINKTTRPQKAFLWHPSCSSSSLLKIQETINIDLIVKHFPDDQLQSSLRWQSSIFSCAIPSTSWHRCMNYAREAALEKEKSWSTSISIRLQPGVFINPLCFINSLTCLTLLQLASEAYRLHIST